MSVPILGTYHCLFADMTTKKKIKKSCLMVSMPINNKLFNFTKTSAHVILYLLNWNLFARHKDSLAESTSHSTAERVQKGPQDEQLLQAEGGSARAMPGDQISTALREAGDCQSQH